MSPANDIEWVEKLISEHDKRHIQRIEDLEKATIVAKEAMEQRLEQMNEWRNQLEMNEQTYLPRLEYLALHSKIEGDLQKAIDSFDADIRMLRESKALLEGKASQSSVNTAMLISVGGLLISFLTLLLNLFKII